MARYSTSASAFFCPQGSGSGENLLLCDAGQVRTEIRQRGVDLGPDEGAKLIDHLPRACARKGAGKSKPGAEVTWGDPGGQAATLQRKHEDQCRDQSSI